MAGGARGPTEVRSVHPSLSAKLLTIVLRIGGVVMLFATLAIALPTPWMAVVHGSLGMGELPRAGIMEYLTRSLSALYALHGGLLLVVSRDVRRHVPVITYLAVANVPLGGILLAIDLHAGMPWYWTLGEGPLVSLTGIVLLLLVRGLAREDRAATPAR